MAYKQGLPMHRHFMVGQPVYWQADIVGSPS